jgi:hypothetical protein
LIDAFNDRNRDPKTLSQDETDMLDAAIDRLTDAGN